MRAAPTPTTTLDAVVLRTTAYGDADLVVQLLAPGRGRLGAFARGARKGGKRYSGAIEPFSIVRVEVAERRGSDLLDLKSASIVEPHLGLRDEIGRLAHAGYAVELVRELAREREPNDAMYALLTGFLDALARKGPKSLRLRALELGALGAAGLSPQLDACARCHRPFAPTEPALWDAMHGGATCRSCAPPGAMPLDAAALALLRAIQRTGLAGAEAADEEGLALEPARRALRAFVDHHVHHHLRSLQFLRDVGAPP